MLLFKCLFIYGLVLYILPGFEIPVCFSFFFFKNLKTNESVYPLLIFLTIYVEGMNVLMTPKRLFTWEHVSLFHIEKPRGK